MHRIFTTLATTLLIGTGGISLHAADEEGKEKDAPAQVIRWTGSAYQEGDAFILTARIFERRVELQWDGFAGDSFVFLDDRELKPAARVKKDYIFTDNGTVEAFRTLASEAEQCNPGPSMVMGQGISTEVLVEVPPGTRVQRMHFFATPPQLLKANRFEAIPFQVKDLVRGPTPRDVSPEDFFPRSLRHFAGELSRPGACLGKLEAAYRARGELPLVDLEALRAPLPVGPALAKWGYKPGAAESTAKLVATVEAVLADCMGPVHRAGFVPAGKERGEGGILLAVEEATFSPAGSRRWIPQECLPVKIGKAERPPMNLPTELEQVLLRFLGGPALSKNAAALERGLVPAETYRLGISEQGGLNLGFSDSGNVFRSFSHLNLNLESTLEHPELRARLEYLNSKGIVRFLLGREAEEGQLPALVRIRSVNLYSEDLKRARIEFDQDDARRVVELHLVEGQWMPVKSQTWEEYQGEDPFSPSDKDETK